MPASLLTLYSFASAAQGCQMRQYSRSQGGLQMEECGMKSRTPVTRQGWRWVLCGAGSAQRQDARLQRPRHSPSCVFVWPAPALCCAPDCSLSGHQLLYPHHHTSVGNTANGTHKITLRITCTWLAWLGGWVVLSES